ncbi:hypothetical protein ACFL1Y_01945 [Patescibacteria group bacterium]
MKRTYFALIIVVIMALFTGSCAQRTEEIVLNQAKIIDYDYLLSVLDLATISVPKDVGTFFQNRNSQLPDITQIKTEVQLDSAVSLAKKYLSEQIMASEIKY